MKYVQTYKNFESLGFDVDEDEGYEFIKNHEQAWALLEEHLGDLVEIELKDPTPHQVGIFSYYGKYKKKNSIEYFEPVFEYYPQQNTVNIERSVHKLLVNVINDGYETKKMFAWYISNNYNLEISTLGSGYPRVGVTLIDVNFESLGFDVEGPEGFKMLSGAHQSKLEIIEDCLDKIFKNVKRNEWDKNTDFYGKWEKSNNKDTLLGYFKFNTDSKRIELDNDIVNYFRSILSRQSIKLELDEAKGTLMWYLGKKYNLEILSVDIESIGNYVVEDED